jgi:hypothetical protein
MNQAPRGDCLMKKNKGKILWHCPFKMFMNSPLEFYHSLPIPLFDNLWFARIALVIYTDSRHIVKMLVITLLRYKYCKIISEPIAYYVLQMTQCTSIRKELWRRMGTKFRYSKSIKNVAIALRQFRNNTAKFRKTTIFCLKFVLRNFVFTLTWRDKCRLVLKWLSLLQTHFSPTC